MHVCVHICVHACLCAYLRACMSVCIFACMYTDRRADFVPFVVTTDGCIGDQGDRFFRRLGKRLAEKWGKAYSEVAGLLF